MPADDTIVTRFTLLAQGGHLVSSEREGGEIKYVGLKSQLGQPATLAGPWGSEPAQVIKLSNGSKVTTTGTAELVRHRGRPDVRVLKRSAKPLSGYDYAHDTAEASAGQKSLPSTACKIGLGGAPQADTGNYEAEAAALDVCTPSGVDAGDSGANLDFISAARNGPPSATNRRD